MKSPKATLKKLLALAAIVALVALGCWIARPYFIADEQLMWETHELSSGSGKASTHRAQEAAKRVFGRKNLIGMTQSELIAEIGSPTESNQSIYNFPFYPAPEGALVYRFDTGAYGWQFNVLFDGEGRVREIEHHGIE
jgi:hypothetical protein